MKSHRLSFAGSTEDSMLTVMQSFPAPRSTTNPYLVQLVGSVADSVNIVHFSWANALRGKFDVLHLHWPENLCRSPTRWKAWLRRGAFLALLLRIRWTGGALVRTLHNVQPHEQGGRVERWLLRLCDRTTTLWITLTVLTEAPVPHAEVVVIPHGDYRSWFDDVPRPAAERGRMLYFGLIRPYKGVESLLEAFTNVHDPTLRLRIAGKPVDPALGARILAASDADRRISANLSYIDDRQLALEVGRAEIVVLPYRSLQNSGSLLLALSLDRPVLVPDNAISRQLADEVGDSWVLRYSGALTARALQDAVAAASREHRTARPNLDLRTWDFVGKEHVAAYRKAVRLSADGRRRWLP